MQAWYICFESNVAPGTEQYPHLAQFQPSRCSHHSLNTTSGLCRGNFTAQLTLALRSPLLATIRGGKWWDVSFVGRLIAGALVSGVGWGVPYSRVYLHRHNRPALL
jgi:hypothetical protein